jgi:sec-independent protein translocase protein TatA
MNQSLAMIGGIGVMELVLIFLVLLLLFGAKRIPQIARGLGEGIRNFKGGVRDPGALPPGEDQPENGRGRRDAGD